jgi:hypothetical protein
MLVGCRDSLATQCGKFNGGLRRVAIENLAIASCERHRKILRGLDWKFSGLEHPDLRVQDGPFRAALRRCSAPGRSGSMCSRAIFHACRVQTAVLEAVRASKVGRFCSMDGAQPET